MDRLRQKGKAGIHITDFQKIPALDISDLAAWMPRFYKTGAKLFIQLTAGFGRSFTISEFKEMKEGKTH